MFLYWVLINLAVPFWIKPIKSYHSYLAYRIDNHDQFSNYMKRVRRLINYLDLPFRFILEQYGMHQLAGMPEKMIAESLVSGHQFTAEGYAFGGEIIVYGIVDVIRAEGRSSVTGYEYPSSLPQQAKASVEEVVQRAVRQTGLSDCAFNADLFYNFDKKKVFLLEINPRISQAFTDLFEKVHGISHHGIMLNLALNRKPKELGSEGKARVAGHFMIRSFTAGRVVQVPSEEELGTMKRKFPGLEIFITVQKIPTWEDWLFIMQIVTAILWPIFILEEKTGRCCIKIILKYPET